MKNFFFPPDDNEFIPAEHGEEEHFCAEEDIYMTADPTDPTDNRPELYESVPPTDGESTCEYFPEDEDFSSPLDIERRPAKKKSTGWKVLHALCLTGKYLLGVILAVAILAGGVVGYLTMVEYNPAHAETAQRGGNSVKTSYEGQALRIVTFNTGYGALDKNADFFMDGGKTVSPESEGSVLNNMRGIEEILKSCQADIIFLQEVDTDSDRSFHQNQFLQYEHNLENYESRFALNYSCEYVPYPLTDCIGEVQSGIATYSRYHISSATRYSLPCPFSWPTRVANLKRCMLVTRIPIKDKNESELELVLVNVHLEAYDDGEGRIAQMEQLTQFMEEEYAKGNYVIVGGDFNQLFPNTELAYPLKSTSQWQPQPLGELPAGFRYAFDSVVPSCRLLNQPLNPSSSQTQYYIIDGFIVSANVSVSKIEALDLGFVYADHNPVVLDVNLILPGEEEE